MFRGIIGKMVFALGGIAFLQQGGLAQEACGPNGCSTCRTCQTHHCPPSFHWCQEVAPRIRFQHGCPKPICNPCDLPNWGYYQTCWTPWPFPPDYSHCHPLTPAAHGGAAPTMPPAGNGAGNGTQLPPIRKGL